MKKKKYNLIVYDTSNFIDFPIGGQITSIRNFLKYLSDFQIEFCKNVLLVGVTNKKEDVGKVKAIRIGNQIFDFLPVIFRSKNLSNVKKSLRKEYVVGLIKYLSLIKINTKTINYIHTPEAVLALKVKYPFSKYIVFSHGSFFNMKSGFRFYKNDKLILFLFEEYLKLIIKNAKIIFTLDTDSTNQYIKYNKNIIHTDNSIVLENKKNPKNKLNNPIELIFVGRLSKIKRVDKIIQAVEKISNVRLKIVGDGEELLNLKELSNKSKKITFVGSVPPDKVKEYMNKSDILIMNSEIEGKPMTIIEAMSYGLPIITTDVGGIKEMVSNHYDSEITDGTIDSIIEGVQKIISNYYFYSKNAFEKSKKYDYTIVNSKIFNIINEINNLNKNKKGE